MLTPEGSIIVSLTTPQGTTLSEQPSIRTDVSSESMVTQPDLSRDIGRIAEDLRRYHEARGDEARGISDNVQALRNELQDLSEFLRRTPPPPPLPPPTQRAPQEPSQPPSELQVPRWAPQLPEPIPPPEVEHVNRSVGGSSILSLATRGLTIAADQVTLTRATSSASSIGSFLSSHHSDDDLLASESYPDSPPPPPWPAPSIADAGDSSYFSETSSYDSGPYHDRSGSSSLPPLPPSSPTPSSSTSTVTVRPLPTPPDLLGPLNAIRDQLTALWDGQTSTNHMLDELRDRRIPQPDNTELIERLHRIEDLLQALLSQGPREAEIITVPPPPASAPPPPASVTDSDDSLSRLRDILTSFGQEPEIPAPIPARAHGPSLVQQLDEILSSAAHLPPVVVEQPPRLVPFVYQPAERGARARSASPVSLSTLPRRADTEPPTFVYPYWPWRRRDRRERRRPQPSHPPAQVSDVGATEGPAVIPVARPGEPDIDMLRAVQDRRKQQQPGTDGTFYAGPTPRPTFVRIMFFNPGCVLC